MSQFDQSYWADSTYSQGYRDTSVNFIVDRHTHLMILESVLRHFVGVGRSAALLDLGCGDAILAHHLLSVDPTVQATAVDGSADMLTKARDRLAEFPEVRYVQRTFQEIIADSSELGQYDYVVSAFAIHHLNLSEKVAMFQTILNHLKPGGIFINTDTVYPNNPAYTDWYYSLFREWIEAREQRLQLDQSFVDVPDQARNNPDNQLSDLASQLASLKALGFANVECHYKYGLFAMYGGQKAA